jgi:hypothetical protein
MGSLEMKEFWRVWFKLCKLQSADLFPSENAHCLFGDQLEDKYLYWEVCSFDLQGEDVDDTADLRKFRDDFWILHMHRPQNLIYLSCTTAFQIKSFVKNKSQVSVI